MQHCKISTSTVYISIAHVCEKYSLTRWNATEPSPEDDKSGDFVAFGIRCAFVNGFLQCQKYVENDSIYYGTM